MAAAHSAGSPEIRVQMALQAGCDMVLVCNDRDAAVAVLGLLEERSDPASQVRLARLHGRKAPEWSELVKSPLWRQARVTLAHLADRPELVLDG
jgi:beta-N-acetylhexosaminidase